MYYELSTIFMKHPMNEPNAAFNHHYPPDSPMNLIIWSASQTAAQGVAWEQTGLNRKPGLHQPSQQPGSDGGRLSR